MSDLLKNDITLVLRAASFAAHKHRDQRRKDQGASPYINHPLSLASILADAGAVTDATTLCAALLHDTIEDTQTTEQEIAEAFGAEIAAIVMEVTDDKRLDKAARKQAQIAHAASISSRAKLVKLADKISNVRDIAFCPPANWSIERKREYFDWAKAVVDQLRGINPALEQVFDCAYLDRP